jgi:hypothetical protein
MNKLNNFNKKSKHNKINKIKIKTKKKNNMKIIMNKIYKFFKNNNYN